MTGSRTVAYAHEPEGDYAGTVTDSDYKVPGKNPTVENVTLNNALQRMRLPNDPQAVESVAQNFEGAFKASWTVTTPWFHNHLFGGAPSLDDTTTPNTYTWSFPDDGSWQVQGSRWYMGLDTASATVERELKGVVIGQLEVNCSVGQTVTVTATGFYADEAHNTAITPSSLVGTGAEAMTFDGGSLEIPDGSAVGMMQDATLTINTKARPVREWQRSPSGAVLGGVETTLEISKIVEDESQLQLAYGGGSSPGDDVAGEGAGSLTFTTSGSAELTYDLARITPNAYDWSNLADADADVLEDVTYFVDDVQAVAKSDATSAK